MDKVSAVAAGVQFEALLLAQVLSPLAQSFGQFGSLAIAPLAQSIAADDAHGFGNLLATALEQHVER